jgi:hypothetical protein
MKAGDLVAFKLEVKDRKRSNVRYRNGSLGLGLIVKHDPAGVMYFVRWGQRSGWYCPELLEMVNESR